MVYPKMHMNPGRNEHGKNRDLNPILHESKWCIMCNFMDKTKHLVSWSYNLKIYSVTQKPAQNKHLLSKT